MSLSEKINFITREIAGIFKLVFIPYFYNPIKARKYTKNGRL
jgi:hypothetical protein